MRLLKAIDFIETHLTEPMTSAQVADAACLSPYHFCRMFRALTGETVMCYIRRRRLTEAARRLARGEDRLIDLAVEYGFESQAAFSRAFKRHFGVAPGQYRRAACPMPWKYRRPFSLDDLEPNEELQTMEPRIVTKPAFKAVGLAGQFAADATDGIPALWERFGAYDGEIENPLGSHYLGLCFGGQDDDLTYVAAREVTDLEKLPDGLVGHEVEAQTYAVFTIGLTEDEPIGKQMGRAHRHIWDNWLPSSDYAFAEAPDFEHYDERFDPATKTGEIDIYIPVRKA